MSRVLWKYLFILLERKEYNVSDLMSIIMNNMNIYSISIRDNINEDAFRHWVEKVSTEKRTKVKKFKFFDDKKRSVYGELILRYALIHDLGIKNKEIIIDVDINGKPYLKESEHIFFNISHSGEYVVCAIDFHPIGVDVEFIGNADVAVAKRAFTLNEYKQIFSGNGNANTLFYQFWTLKESYVKYKGEGLRIPFDSFCFFMNDGVIRMESKKKENVYFLSIIFDERYCVSVCTEDKYELERIVRLSINDLKIIK